MRISIIGQPASGKSTLAEKISNKLVVPYMHLDRLYFEGGLYDAKTEAEKEKGRAYIRKYAEQFVRQESWVSDGWYSRVQPLISERADVIIYLDVSFLRRLVNHVRRAGTPGRHQELAVWDEITFVADMVRRMFTHEPKIRAFAQANADKTVVLRSHEEIDRYLEQI